MSTAKESRTFGLADCQFTIPEAADHLRVSRSYLYELIAERKIRPIKLGKRTLIQGPELRRFMKSLAASLADDLNDPLASGPQP